jgi:hypothetical protein
MSPPWDHYCDVFSNSRKLSRVSKTFSVCDHKSVAKMFAQSISQMIAVTIAQTKQLTVQNIFNTFDPVIHRCRVV